MKVLSESFHCEVRCAVGVYGGRSEQQGGVRAVTQQVEETKKNKGNARELVRQCVRVRVCG